MKKSAKKLLKIPCIVMFFSFIAFVLGTLLHNLLYGISGTEEAVFFFIAIISAGLFVLSLIYVIVVTAVLLLKR